MPEEINDAVASQYDGERWFVEMFKLCMYNYNTCLPCKVVGVNTDTQTVDIQPLIKAYVPYSKSYIDRPVIKGVPFWTYRAGDTYITLPIKVGDTGIAIFAQRDISSWKEVGGSVPTPSNRIMDYNDALYIPYIAGKNSPIKNYNSEYIEIVKNGKTITVKDGTLEAPEYDLVCKNITCQDIESNSLHATSTVVSDTDCISGTISGRTHTHGGVSSGPSTTGVPQ